MTLSGSTTARLSGRTAKGRMALADLLVGLTPLIALMAWFVLEGHCSRGDGSGVPARMAPHLR